MLINIDYKRKEPAENQKGDWLTNSQLTYDYVTFAVKQKYDRGLESQWRRIWGRLQNKFEEAIDNKVDEITLELSEIDFIKRAVRDAKYPVAIAKYVNLFEDVVEALK